MLILFACLTFFVLVLSRADLINCITSDWKSRRTKNNVRERRKKEPGITYFGGRKTLSRVQKELKLISGHLQQYFTALNINSFSVWNLCELLGTFTGSLKTRATFHNLCKIANASISSVPDQIWVSNMYNAREEH